MLVRCFQGHRGVYRKIGDPGMMNAERARLATLVGKQNQIDLQWDDIENAITHAAAVGHYFINYPDLLKEESIKRLFELGYTITHSTRISWEKKFCS